MSLENLSEEAKVAYQAFQDMSQSKQAYFSLLQEIDGKYKNGGAPSANENQQLEELLRIHDKNVTAFNIAMSEVADQASRMALIKLMS